MNVKVFKLMLGETNEKHGLNKSTCNSKQKWNRDECRCECKELDDMGSCKNDTARILVRVIVNVKMRVKLTNI